MSWYNHLVTYAQLVICLLYTSASHGGFKDWFIEEFHKPGFTIEVGKGKNPLDCRRLDEIYNRIEEMLVLGIVL